MKRFILLFISFALFSFHSAFAQGFVVKGTVTAHEDGSPLIGVTVLQKGTTNGVVTDMDGNYSFEVKGASDAILVFSYIGMQSQSHQVNASTGVLNVVLKSDAEMIDEVVVVAYGVRKKGTIAGRKFRPGFAGADAGFVRNLEFGRAERAGRFPDSWYKLHQFRYGAALHS